MNLTYYNGSYDAEILDECYGFVFFEGSSGYYLMVCINGVKNRDDLMGIWIAPETSSGTLPDFADYGIWLDNYMYAEVGIEEKFMDYMENHIAELSLERAEQILAEMEYGEMLTPSKFMCYKHRFEETYTNYQNNDYYNIYIQTLSDTDEYLKLYVYENGDARFVFKVELYDSLGELEREMYSDLERYQKERQR